MAITIDSINSSIIILFLKKKNRNFDQKKRNRNKLKMAQHNTVDVYNICMFSVHTHTFSAANTSMYCGLVRWPYAIFLLPLHCNNNFLLLLVLLSDFQHFDGASVAKSLISFARLRVLIATMLAVPTHSVPCAVWFPFCIWLLLFSHSILSCSHVLYPHFLGICTNPKYRLNTQDTIWVYFIANV